MRVGINLTQLLSGRIGGTETYVRALLKNIQEVDGQDRYTLFCLPDDAIPIRVPNFEKITVGSTKANSSGLPYRVFRVALRSLLHYDILGHTIAQHRSKIDLMHYPLSIIWPLPTISPAVLTLHDIQHEFYPEFFSRRELNFRKRAYPESVHMAARVIAISEFTRQTIIEKYSFDPQRATTIYYGLDIKQFSSAQDQHQLLDIKAKRCLPDRFVFYPANSWPHKNHATLFSALKILKDHRALSFKLVLAGVIYPEQRGLMDQVCALGLADDILHLGYVPHAEIPLIYKQALCLVFPSLFEGFGAPVIEAMGSECPVICSNATSLPEIVGDAALTVEPRDAQALARALQQVAEDSALRQKLIRLGLGRAAKFSWAETARQTIAVYRAAYSQPMSVE
jgi:glycosyltransferase involved in cell wall biosynthesis